MTAAPDVQSAATEAWAAMLRGRTVEDIIARVRPMPAGVAIDFVQNICGERDESLTALLGAAARWVESRVPAIPATTDEWADEFDGACRSDAQLVGEYLEAESSMASVFVGHIAERVWARTSADVLLRDKWRLWVVDARLAIDLCREVSAAAYPE